MMKMCNKIINNLKLDINEFKEFYLNNNYNENMFKSDGSINPEYNSKKNTGLIAKIFEEHWDNIPTDIKASILKYKPNADKEIKKIINCYNKNLGCNVYHCPDCNECCFIGHTCKSRFCSSCGYKYKLERVENEFDRGEITIDSYIKKLTELRKSYKINSEGYKELTQKIKDAIAKLD